MLTKWITGAKGALMQTRKRNFGSKRQNCPFNKVQLLPLKIPEATVWPFGFQEKVDYT